MACATCHDPAHAYGPTNDLAVQLGGPRGTSPGLRAVPSLRYKEFTPGYRDTLDNPDGFSIPGPGGGFAWDGRADSLAEQAQAPLTSPFEMANADAADVVSRLRRSPSAAAFVRAFGAAALADVDVAYDKLRQALQAFQIEDPSFHPYSSKYDLLPLRAAGRRADRRRSARPEGVQGREDRQLLRLPPGRREPGRRRAAAADRLFVRGHRRPAQPADPRQSRSRARRPRPVRSAAHRPRPAQGGLRSVQDPDVAQRGRAARVLSQRRHAFAGAGGPLLQHARHAPRALVSDQRRPREGEVGSRLPDLRPRHHAIRRRQGAEVRRPARAPTARTWTTSCRSTAAPPARSRR